MFKTYADTYIFSKGVYQNALIKFIMESDRISKEDLLDTKSIVKKRQVSLELSKILDSDFVIFCYSDTKPMPHSFKVFTAKDLASSSKQLRVFVDLSGIYDPKDKTCFKIDTLIAYLTAAHTNLLYYKNHDDLMHNNVVLSSGMSCFSKMFTNVIDYMYKISVVESKKEVSSYLAAKYFCHSLMGIDYDDTRIQSKLLSVSKLSNLKYESLVPLMYETKFGNIRDFISMVGEALKLDKLNIDNFIEKWLMLYGLDPFALEYFPSFASMLTYAFTGAYLNNQRTIEKILGMDLVEFSRTILSIKVE